MITFALEKIKSMTIRKETSIEDLVNALPASVKYLSEKGIKCIACGEPVWGTIEEAALEKGYEKDDIESFIRDLNKLLDQFDK
jgi:methionine synthase II (cobalamin-independent)